ncbi:hypothetical protein BDP55DRAFT_5118 [Colletotrichum godetiae]|uniref:Uncharacterized protein n=1 Tax=Colletotrichum godetiae TaxID=1209918 RepID=A0AAJ0B206_9PEZI|nr:uncharacterized protein BDP55DRAFT_5118 [Colletotrichum godetiae]KAK1700990.1 hypothetical protein BDP55DRAFT_5118 [Colletotrichum godetiae]
MTRKDYGLLSSVVDARHSPLGRNQDFFSKRKQCPGPDEVVWSSNRVRGQVVCKPDEAITLSSQPPTASGSRTHRPPPPPRCLDASINYGFIRHYHQGSWRGMFKSRHLHVKILASLHLGLVEVSSELSQVPFPLVRRADLLYFLAVIVDYVGSI